MDREMTEASSSQTKQVFNRFQLRHIAETKIKEIQNSARQVAEREFYECMAKCHAEATKGNFSCSYIASHLQTADDVRHFEQKMFDEADISVSVKMPDGMFWQISAAWSQQ